MFEDLNITQKDKFYLIFLAIFSTLLVAYYINFNDSVGIFCSDVYVYLLNAVYYTGTNLHSTSTIYLSPVICFLTSVFFDLGFQNKLAIYIVTGAFAILGNIGFYVLLKRYFNETLSLTGAIIYSTCTLYLTWLANGTLDIPATSMIIWTALFTIIAINDNPKYYEYAIPLLILGFFTRYTVLLLIPAFLLYYVYENGFKIKNEDAKHIKKGIKIAVIISVIILAIILIMGMGRFGASYQISNGITGQQGEEIDPAYNTDVSYYLFNFPNFISNSHTVFETNPVLESPTVLSWTIFAILIIGAGLWLYENRIKFEKKDIIPLIIFLVAIITYTRISSFITIILSLLGLYLIGKDSKYQTGYFMLAWILCNFLFISYYSIKVNRYAIPILPPLVYFLLISIDLIHRHVKINQNLIPAALIILFIIQGFAFTATFEPTDEYRATEDISNYIIDTNPDYKNISIGVYNIRPYSWWLGENVIGLVSGNQTAIDESNVTYYISNNKLDNLTNYTEIKNINQLYLYEKSV